LTTTLYEVMPPINNSPIGTIILFFVLSTVMPFIGLSVSISFTRSISALVARNCGNRTAENLLIFPAMLATHYFLLGLWVPITQSTSGYFEVFLVQLSMSSTSGIPELKAIFPWHIYLWYLTLSQL
jgi:hypothetical protein